MKITISFEKDPPMIPWELMVEPLSPVVPLSIVLLTLAMIIYTEIHLL